MDIAKLITDRIIAELEAGTAPWVKPWSEACEAYNPLSGTVYRGINQFWLGMHGLGRSNAWMTFKQAASAKLRIKAGSKGVPVVFWKTLEVERTRSNGEAETATVPMLRSYYVFNGDDIEGASFHRDRAALTGTLDSRVNEVVERLCLAGGVQLASGAFYNGSRDCIGMPAFGDFRSESDYSATLLHECTHATGHASRLDRKLSNRFGSEAYAYEELIAELGAAMLCMRTGVDGKLQHASYIASWLQVLRGDKTAIVKAASAAQKACDYLTVTQSAEELAA